MTPFWITAFLDFATRDFETGTAFWAGVTGSRVSAPRGSADEFATLVPPDGDAYLRVQQLDYGPGRIHLDLHVADPRAAADRAVALGALWTVLTDPTGAAYCLTDRDPATGLLS